MLLATLAPAAARQCGAYGAAERIAEPAALSVHEASGLAASRRRPGLLYAHDDSGHAAVLHAVTIQGEAQGGHPMPRGWVNDWEDIAAGPCPPPDVAQACLYVGDIGDNRRRRAHILIRVVVEPPPDAAAGSPLDLLATWRLRYPDGPRNAEALLVHPKTGVVEIVTKSLSDPAEVYRVPAGVTESAEPTLLARVATLDLGPHAGDPMVTGGDWDPDGDRLVLRTYTSLLVWPVDRCAASPWWAGAPQVLDAPRERQGEAVTVGLDGHVYTASEGHPMPLSRRRCLQPVEPADCSRAVETPAVETPPPPAADPPQAAGDPPPAAAEPPPDPPACGCAPVSPVGAALVGVGLLGAAARRRQSKKRRP